MPIPDDLYRIQYTFSLGADGEVAVTGFHCRYDPDGGASNVAAGLLAAHAEGSWDAGWNSRVADFATSVRLIQTAAYHVIAGAGPADFLATNPIASGAQWHGTGSDSLPWEDSLVVTLEGLSAGTNLPHARRYRGRAYLPPMVPGILSGAAGFVDATSLGNFVTASSAWLEGFNDTVSGTQARVVVLSRVGETATDVDHVSMDAQMDLQKRRQNRQTRPTRVVGDPLDA